MRGASQAPGFVGGRKLDAMKTKDYDYEILTYAYQAYGFLLDAGERLTGPEFADRIVNGYDVSNRQNAEVVRVLRLHPEIKFGLSED